MANSSTREIISAYLSFYKGALEGQLRFVKQFVCLLICNYMSPNVG